jgi:hypothetical protein
MIHSLQILQIKFDPFLLEFFCINYSVALVRNRTIPTERPPLVGEVGANFAVRGCRVVSATDPHGRILGFLDRSLYYLFQVAPQLYARG